MWKVVWLIVFSTLYLVGTGPSSSASETNVTEHRGWQILVFDNLPAPNEHGTAKWITVWANGLTTKKFSDLMITIDGHLFVISTKSEEAHAGCKDGKFPFSYAIDQLIAQPIEGGPPKVILGQTHLASAKELMHEHLASCDGIKALPHVPDTTESYEHNRFQVLSIYQQILGLKIITESFSYVRPEPMRLEDWRSYTLGGGELKKVGRKLLPADVLADATRKFYDLPQIERDVYSPPDFTHYVLMPAGGGVKIVFAVPATTPQSKPATRLVHVVRESGLNEEYQVRKQAFVSQHPKMINWDKVSFYSVAPDESAVVWASAGKLYWQAVGGQAKEIASVGQVQGWQWFTGSTLSASEQRLLGTN